MYQVKQKAGALALSLLMLLSLISGCGSANTSTLDSEAASSKRVESVPAESLAITEEQEKFAASDLISIEEPTESEVPSDFSIDTFDWGTVEFPLTTEEKTFTYFFATQPFMMSYAGSFDYENLPFFTTMEERSGIHLKLTVVPMMNASEQFNLMITSGDYANLIEGVPDYYNGSIDDAISEEVIYGMDDIVADYMPNYEKWLNYDVDYRRALTSPEGELYAAGYLKVGTVSATTGGLIRQDWLDEANLDVPLTYDEMDAALAAFQSNGHSGALWMNTGLKETGSNYNICSGYDVSNGFLVKDGVVEYTYVTDCYRDYVELLNSWWNKGYIYSDFITVEGEIDTGLVLNGDIGVWSGANSAAELMEESATDGLQITPFSSLRKNADDQLHICISNTSVQGTISISTTTKPDDIELLAKWMDYQYSYDGFMLSNYGEQGVAYELDADGQPQLTDLVVNSTDYITPVGIVLYTKYGGCGICYDVREYFSWSDSDWAASETWTYNNDTDYMLPYNMSLSTEEKEVYATYFNDLKTYIDENLLMFITGEAPITEWDTFVDVVYSMGMQEVIDAYQSAYDRYIA